MSKRQNLTLSFEIEYNQARRFVNMKVKVVILAIIISMVMSCKSNNCEIDDSISQIQVDIEFERLEDQLFSIKTKEELRIFLNSNGILKKEFLASDQYPDDSILINNLYSRLSNPYIDTLLQETRKEFDEFSEVGSSLESMLKHLKYFYPETKGMKVETLVTGMGSSEMFVSDSLVIIGLDYYIGPDATYRPIGLPNYILLRYQKEYIVPAIALLLSNKYIKENSADRTMLADMIYYGKRFYFTKQMMPCTQDSLIMWYSGQQLEDISENEDAIWAYFISNELLYETNHLTKTKYMDERPTVFEIGDKCPGRIGSWLGWQIVESYMNANPDVTLQALMENPNAREIFDKSNYKPKRR